MTDMDSTNRDAEDCRRNRIALEPGWIRLREYCAKELRYGEIKIQIQDGQPVAAEYIKKKLKFI
jgi:hypothetical protein